jgi:hypothetical protein
MISQTKRCVLRRTTSLLGSLGVAGTLFLAFGSPAQWGSGNAVYTEQGIEISADSRVVSLYAMLNGHGYDEETVRGPPPLKLPQYTEARVKARTAMGRPGTGMRKLGKLIEKKPGSARKYIKSVLQLGQSPTFEPPGKITKLGKAVYGPLRTWYNEEGGLRVHKLVSDAVRPDQRKLKTLLEKTCEPLVSAVRLGDEEEQLLDDTGPSGRVVIALNPLDSHDVLRRITLGSTTYMVSGMSTDAEWRRLLHSTALAFVGTLIHVEIKKAAVKGTLADGYEILPAGIKKRIGSKEDYMTEITSCAILKQVHPGSECLDSPLPLEGKKLAPVVNLVGSRVKEYLESGQLFQEAAAAMIAPESASGGTGDAGVSDVDSTQPNED